MKKFQLFLLEMRRLLSSRITWLVMGLTILSPLAGLTLYRPLYSNSQSDYVTTTLGAYLANPALAGGLLGGILFAVLTAAELDRARNSSVDVLTDSMVSPLDTAIIRIASLISTAVITQAAVMIVWLPYTSYAAGSVFDLKTYVTAYIAFMFGALPLAILFAAAAYQMTCRFDLALVLFAVFAGLSLTVWKEEWQLCWLNPCVWAISDDFSNHRIFRVVIYMRSCWFLGLSGLWCVSYLCIRRYGKGIAGSLKCNIRRIYRPAVAVLLLVCAGTAYAAQPFIDDSAELIDADAYYNVENLEDVTCSERYADVRPNWKTGEVFGTATYQIQNTSGQERKAQFVTRSGYDISSVKANGEDVPYGMVGEQEMNTQKFEVTLPAEEEIELTIEYGGFPQEWNIMSTMQGEPEISDQYMKLENEVLAPAPYNLFYRDAQLPATMDITLPSSMTPVLFGTGTTELLKENEDGTKTWQMKDEGYYMILYAGDYVCEEIEASGITVNFYYGRKHKPVMEAADAADAIREVIEYCTEHYGPLESYQNGTLNLIQSRVTGGGYAAAGASMLDEIDFTAQNLGNTEKGGGAGEVMIHELVHQWWGLGNMFDSEDSQSVWSAEGLTVYTTYRIVKELYGEEYAQENYIEQWQKTVDDYEKDFYVRHPEYFDKLPEKYRNDIANSIAGIRQYNEMPLKIKKAEELVGGESAMDKILHDLFNREIDYTYPYLTYQEFLDECGLTEEELELE